MMNLAQEKRWLDRPQDSEEAIGSTAAANEPRLKSICFVGKESRT
jgi:hypothetical protein